MRDVIRDKDFLAGALFVLIGGFFALGALDYSIGTARRMGPGYFPVMLGSILAIIGVILAGKSVWERRAELVPRLYVRPVLALSASILAFSLLLERAGLILACIATVLIAGLGSRETRLWELLAVAISMAAISSLLFVMFLGLPIRLWRL